MSHIGDRHCSPIVNPSHVTIRVISGTQVLPVPLLGLLAFHSFAIVVCLSVLGLRHFRFRFRPYYYSRITLLA